MTHLLGAELSLPRRFSRVLQRHTRPGRLASLGLLAVLIALPGFALWGAASTYQTGVAVKHATELSNAFEEARYAVGAEESLERKYRLEPGEEVRGSHRSAAITLAAALQRARTLGAPADHLLIDDVLARHEQYLQAISRMFAAVDAGDTEATNAIDKDEADPVFDMVEDQVDAAADQHRIDAAEHLAALAAIQRSVLIATPVVFALGVGLVVFFWRMARTNDLAFWYA